MSQFRFTLRQLQYFVGVVQAGQISSAAAQAHVTQSTMTAAIAELEKALDVLLFERTRQGVSLTYQGHLFLQHATAVLEAASNASRHPFREPSNISGTIELAASYAVLGYFLLPHIAKFQKQHPGASVIPVERDRSEIEHSVGAGEIELGVALTSNLKDPRRFHRQALARSRRQLWVADDHPLADESHISLQRVAPFSYVILTVDEGEDSAMRFWTEANIEPASLLRTSSMEAVREMVACGLGVTILSDMVFRPWSLDGKRIKAIPLVNAIPPMEVGLIWLKGHKLSPLAEAMRKYLTATVSLQNIA